MNTIIDNTVKLKSENIEHHKKSTVVQRRRKIWQIHSGYHCSVIGACLSRKDLKQIAKKKVFSLESGMDSFAIHRVLTTIADERLPESRVLNKMLDHKFRASIRRYVSLSSDEEVEEQWKKDLNSKGTISGAFWAIMTLPYCGKDLLDRVYGDCHMVGYDVFASHSTNARKTENLQRQVGALQSVLEKTKATYEREREYLKWELGELQKSKAEFLRQRLVNGHLVEENIALKEKLQMRENGEELISLRSERALLRKENEKLRRKILADGEEIAFAAQQSKAAHASIDSIQNERDDLQILNTELKEEITSLEAMFELSIGSKDVCDLCEEKHLNGCEGIGLSGKAVLYVGGRSNMVAHYREMVESNGGIFLHHDGGKENSRNLLPKMLSGADAVLCPVDCVSHDACKCVKKLCKRNSKPYVMMRSAGLSSLAKGLETITQ